MDFYRKLPTDLTEATLSGAAISIATTFIILFLLGAVRGAKGPPPPPCAASAACRLATPPEALLCAASAPPAAAHPHLPAACFPLPCLQELSAYMATQTRTDMVVDRSAHGELLRINFKISFPQLSCEFATLDVSDAMGTVRCRGWQSRPQPQRCRQRGQWQQRWQRQQRCRLWGCMWAAVAMRQALPCHAVPCHAMLRHAAPCCATRSLPPQKRLNLTKTVRKQPITEELQKAGIAVEDRKHHDPKYDEDHPVSGLGIHEPGKNQHPAWLVSSTGVVAPRDGRSGSNGLGGSSCSGTSLRAPQPHSPLTLRCLHCTASYCLPLVLQGFQYEDVNLSTPLTAASFDATAAQYDVLIVNFFAPWCPWCQRLGPTWEAVTEEIHERFPESDGRIRLAKVDCTAEVDLCRKHFITAFPSIRIFRHGSGGWVGGGGLLQRADGGGV